MATLKDLNSEFGLALRAVVPVRNRGRVDMENYIAYHLGAAEVLILDSHVKVTSHARIVERHPLPGWVATALRGGA